VPSVTEILTPLTAGKYPPSGVVAQAANRGTRVHELCALYDMDALPDEFEGELVPYIQAWADFCRDYSPEWLYIEQPVCATDPNGHITAGTLDRLGGIDGKQIVVDIKTAQSFDRASKVSLACQLAAYAWMADVPLSNDGLGVQLLKNGTYRLYWRSDIQQKYFFQALPLFYDLRDIYHITKGS